VHADVVVSTTGERPDTGWLDGTPGMDLSDGILCDEALRVVGLPDVVAAGTAARWPNLRYGTAATRVGQWITALEQGRAAARSLLAGDDAVAFTHVPRFWSEQFGLRIQVCGMLPAAAEVTVTEQHPGRRRPARAGVAVGYRVDGELVGIVAVNAPQAFTTITRSILAQTVHQVAPARSAVVRGPAPAQVVRPGLVAGLPAPVGPPPISGPVPVVRHLYAVS
jgi:hypothetical protein